jgi:hypothetical protein
MSTAASLIALAPAPSPHHLVGALDGVAHELEFLQGQMLRLQEVCNGPEPDPAMIRELQALDLMTQSLAVLAQFLRHLIDELPADAGLDLTDLLRALPLHDLAHRLATRAAGAAGTPPLVFGDSETGDFDLF